MGVSIPDEFRADMAMAGEWQVTEERIVGPGDGENKLDALAMGIRKRAAPGDEDEEEMAMEAKKKRFGSAYRTYPNGEDNSDLDALLSKPLNKLKSDPIAIKAEPEVKTEVSTEETKIKEEPSEEATTSISNIKTEPSDEFKLNPIAISAHTTGSDIKEEPGAATGGVVFKKRKAKNIRQK